MGQSTDVRALLDSYWGIFKVAHDPAATEFLGQCQSHTVKANGKAYKYFERGSGPTVLLVHGLHSNLGSMVPLAAGLLDRGYQVVLFDAPAHGEAPGSSTNPLEVRELIRAVCTSLGDVFAIVGHSLGGLWALSAQPEDVRPRAFVSISTPAEHRFLVEKFAEFQRLEPAVVEEVRKEIEGLLGADAWTEYSPKEIVKTIGVPGLVVHGEKDDFVPSQHAVALHGAWPGSVLELIAGAGHVDVVASPEVSALVADFLGGVGVR